MPQCFQLFDKQTNEAQPLNLIDELICKEVLNTEPHERFYGGDKFNWFDTIGFQIAVGKPLDSDELLNHYKNSDMWEEEYPIIEKIILFLRERYTSRGFYSTKH